ncbi:MAG: HDOD domain-containing protein, partial [Myxococcota bacterium]
TVRTSRRTVEHAVALLGRGRLEALLLAVAVRGALPRTMGFDAQQFWTASARRATTARRLAAVLHPSTQAESFTAALLQDMAVPMLHQAHTTRYASVWAAWQNSDRSTCLTELERSTFGWDHSQVGSWMCAAWSFPEGLTEAIGGHHGTVQGLMAPPAVMLSSQIRDADGIDALDGMIAQLEGDYGIKADDAVELLEESFRDGEAIARLLTP